MRFCDFPEANGRGTAGVFKNCRNAGLTPLLLYSYILPKFRPFSRMNLLVREP